MVGIDDEGQGSGEAGEGAVECVAIERSADRDRGNFLFTPDCDCPRCRPQASVEPCQPATIWVPIDGRPVRREVADLVLGSAGHRLLG